MTPSAPALERAAPTLATAPLAAVSQAPSSTAARLRVGGMAFGNGVLMRAGTHWAWARDDGSVLYGVVPARFSSLRWSRLPLVRSAVAFLEMLELSARLHRRNGARRAGRLLLWLAVMAGVSLALGTVVHALVPQRLLAGVVLQALGLLIALVVLQQGMGAEVWRYHGAEHKAVNAYEAGADLADTASVGAFSRLHDRCGTNLVAIILVLTVVAVPVGEGALGQLASLAAAVVCVAAALELFRLVERHPRRVLSRAVLAVGRALQRVVTTRDPRPEHLALACAALVRVVELEAPATR